MSAIKIVVILVAKAGKEEKLKELLLHLGQRSRAEPGNLRWDVWRDRTTPDRFVLDELYLDDAAVEAHRASSHFADYLSQVGDLAERTSLLLDPLFVA